MAKLTFVNVRGARFAGCTTLTNAAMLVEKINRVYGEDTATLDYAGPSLLVNPKHLDALAELDTRGLTRLPGMEAAPEPAPAAPGKAAPRKRSTTRR